MTWVVSVPHGVKIGTNYSIRMLYQMISYGELSVNFNVDFRFDTISVVPDVTLTQKCTASGT